MRHSTHRLAGIETFPVSAHLIFHHDDREQVDSFINRFGHLFNSVGQRGVTAGDDFVSSPSDELIIRSIRDRYMAGVSIVIVLLGTSTWSRRFVDWEIAAAIGMQDDEAFPFVLFDLDPRARAQIPLPPRLNIGGPPSAHRVDTQQSPEALRDAVGDALAMASMQPHEGHLSRNPLLRHDLR